MNLEDFNKLFVYAILTRDLHYEAQKRLDRGLTDGELADLSDKLRNILNSHLAAIYNNIFRELEDKI